MNERDFTFPKDKFTFETKAPKGLPKELPGLMDELLKGAYGSGAIVALKCIATRMHEHHHAGTFSAEASTIFISELAELAEQIQMETMGKVDVPMDNLKV